MEYPKNNAYYPGSTFGRHAMPGVQFAHQGASAQERKMPCLEGLSLAMVYSPCQSFEKLYEPTEALRCGTLFCKLYMPFTGNRR
jgi:hypothetical protein